MYKVPAEELEGACRRASGDTNARKGEAISVSAWLLVKVKHASCDAKNADAEAATAAD
jgi:hypothetical protein